MSVFKRSLCLLLLLTAAGVSMTAVADNSERAARQAELDAACEAAREEKLAPMRKALVQECVDRKEFDSRAECETFYSDFGARTGGRGAGRAPLFYDLPPCVEAFNYQNSERSGG